MYNRSDTTITAPATRPSCVDKGADNEDSPSLPPRLFAGSDLVCHRCQRRADVCAAASHGAPPEELLPVGSALVAVGVWNAEPQPAPGHDRCELRGGTAGARDVLLGRNAERFSRGPGLYRSGWGRVPDPYLERRLFCPAERSARTAHRGVRSIAGHLRGGAG